MLRIIFGLPDVWLLPARYTATGRGYQQRALLTPSREFPQRSCRLDTSETKRGADVKLLSYDEDVTRSVQENSQRSTPLAVAYIRTVTITAKRRTLTMAPGVRYGNLLYQKGNGDKRARALLPEGSIRLGAGRETR